MRRGERLATTPIADSSPRAAAENRTPSRSTKPIAFFTATYTRRARQRVSTRARKAGRSERSENRAAITRLPNAPERKHRDDDRTPTALREPTIGP